MKTGIYIKLDVLERDALLDLAQRERRDLRDQAALIIRQELERLELIHHPETVPDGTTLPKTVEERMSDMRPEPNLSNDRRATIPGRC